MVVKSGLLVVSRGWGAAPQNLDRTGSCGSTTGLGLVRNLSGEGARMASLDELRQRIDTLDDEIVALLNRRAEAAVEIGRLKNASGSAVFAPGS